jgi:hypothetical protein
MKIPLACELVRQVCAGRAAPRDATWYERAPAAALRELQTTPISMEQLAFVIDAPTRFGAGRAVAAGLGLVVVARQQSEPALQSGPAAAKAPRIAADHDAARGGAVCDHLDSTDCAAETADATTASHGGENAADCALGCLLRLACGALRVAVARGGHELAECGAVLRVPATALAFVEACSLVGGASLRDASIAAWSWLVLGAGADNNNSIVGSDSLRIPAKPKPTLREHAAAAVEPPAESTFPCALLDDDSPFVRETALHAVARALAGGAPAAVAAAAWTLIERALSGEQSYKNDGGGDPPPRRMGWRATCTALGVLVEATLCLRQQRQQRQQQDRDRDQDRDDNFRAEMLRRAVPAQLVSFALARLTPLPPDAAAAAREQAACGGIGDGSREEAASLALLAIRRSLAQNREVNGPAAETGSENVSDAAARGDAADGRDDALVAAFIDAYKAHTAPQSVSQRSAAPGRKRLLAALTHAGSGVESLIAEMLERDTGNDDDDDDDGDDDGDDEKIKKSDGSAHGQQPRGPSAATIEAVGESHRAALLVSPAATSWIRAAAQSLPARVRAESGRGSRGGGVAAQAGGVAATTAPAEALARCLASIILTGRRARPRHHFATTCTPITSVASTASAAAASPGPTCSTPNTMALSPPTLHESAAFTLDTAAWTDIVTGLDRASAALLDCGAISTLQRVMEALIALITNHPHHPPSRLLASFEMTGSGGGAPAFDVVTRLVVAPMCLPPLSSLASTGVPAGAALGFAPVELAVRLLGALVSSLGIVPDESAHRLLHVPSGAAAASPRGAGGHRPLWRCVDLGLDTDDAMAFPLGILARIAGEDGDAYTRAAAVAAARGIVLRIAGPVGRSESSWTTIVGGQQHHHGHGHRHHHHQPGAAHLRSEHPDGTSRDRSRSESPPPQQQQQQTPPADHDAARRHGSILDVAFADAVGFARREAVRLAIAIVAHGGEAGRRRLTERLEGGSCTAGAAGAAGAAGLGAGGADPANDNDWEVRALTAELLHSAREASRDLFDLLGGEPTAKRLCDDDDIQVRLCASRLADNPVQGRELESQSQQQQLLLLHSQTVDHSVDILAEILNVSLHIDGPDCD